MNKIIPFNKDIKFNGNIGEITSIALDDNLNFKDSYTISGDLIVRGQHKYNDIEEDFSYNLPTHIAVDEKYDTSKAKISVDDFYYEIINDNILKVKIDLILDDLYYKENKLEPLRKDVVIEEEVENEENKENVDKEEVIDLFQETSSEKEYSIYRVYLVGENDTLDSILTKYKISKEELSHYNDLDILKAGIKLIIPSVDE